MKNSIALRIAAAAITAAGFAGAAATSADASPSTAAGPARAATAAEPDYTPVSISIDVSSGQGCEAWLDASHSSGHWEVSLRGESWGNTCTVSMRRSVDNGQTWFDFGTNHWVTSQKYVDPYWYYDDSTYQMVACVGSNSAFACSRPFLPQSGSGTPWHVAGARHCRRVTPQLVLRKIARPGTAGCCAGLLHHLR